MFQTAPKAIYDQMFSILDTDSNLDYIVTKQRGFYPRDPDSISPHLYPWAFIEFGGYSTVEPYRSPTRWVYDFTIALVVMAYADKGNIDDMVFRDDDSKQAKGIGDIVADLGNVYWGYKESRFGLQGQGIQDWDIARVGTPSVLSVQRLLMSPYIRGVQMDFVFEIMETS